MAKSRPFAYNPGSQIPGTQTFGNLTVGSHDLTSDQSGVQWWNGPDEDLGYVIAQTNVDGLGNPLQPTQIPNVYGSVGFFRTDGKNTTAFINLTNAISGQNFTTATQCKTWLESNNRWTSWSDFAMEAIGAFKTRVLGDSGNFEAETNLENQLNTLGSTLFDSASLIITPNAYKEQTLYSIKPTEVYTNLILQSENFTISPWILLATPNVTRTANAGASPDGTTTATLLTCNTDLAPRGIRQNIILSPTQKQYVFSCWVRSDNGAVITIDIGDSGTKYFNLTPTWERVSVLSTPSSSGFVDIVFTNNQLGKTFYIWGGQLEESETPGNYIKTTTRPILKGSIGDLDVVRATTATRVNEQGLVELVPYNLFPYSEDFSNSNWSKQNTTIINNSIAAPNGMLTADKIVGNSGVTYNYTSTLGVNVASTSFVSNSTERVVSFYLKYGGLNRIRVIYGASTNLNVGIYVEVDLQLGIITGTYGGSFASNFFIEEAGNGWYRVGFTVIMTIQSTNNRFGIGLGDTTKTVGDGVDGVYVWGAQLVDGSSNKSYQLTTNRLNVPRIDYTTGQPAILVEPQRTNLSLQSEDFTNGWAQEGISVLSNTQTSPDGALTADSIFELGTNDVHRTYRTTAITVTANAIYTASFFVKKSNIRYVRLVLTQQGPTTIWAGAQFDLDTQTFTNQVGTGGGVFSSASITPFINGWYRISVSGSIPGTRMFPVLVLSNGATMLNTDTGGCPIYFGNVNNSLYVWGGQLELGSGITSYIPTTTSTVTRNADIISNTNAYNLIGQTEGTIFIDYNKVLANDSYRNIISLSDASAQNAIEIWDGVGSGNLGRIMYTYFTNNIIKSHGLGQSSVSPSGRYKICLTYIITPSLVNFKIFINGVKLDDRNFTFTAFSSPLSRINIGNRNGIGVGVGSHNLDFILKTRITDERAIQLTTL